MDFLSDKHDRVLKAIGPLLAAFGISDPDMRKITITERSVIETSRYDHLSRSILAHDMPEITTATLLDHYTRSTGFKGIMESQELRLAPVTLRLGHSELAAFALEHGLWGYVESNGTSLPLLHEAAADLFYASFTEPVPSDHLWTTFGDNENGYRLRFEVTPGAAQLRAMRYEAGETLLKRINDALANDGLPRFILKGVSRVGAYYLPMQYQSEDETRLLAKRFPGSDVPVVMGKASEYWPIKIGSRNRTAELKLVEIGLRKLSPTAIVARLPNWCKNVPVVTDP